MSKIKSIYFLIGLTILFFPFFRISYIMLFFLIGALFSSWILKFIVKESMFVDLTQLFLTMSILLLIVLIMGTHRLPLFIIGGALAITTFGKGVAEIIQQDEFYSAKPSIAFLIIGSMYAFFAFTWITWNKSDVDHGMLLFLSVMGALTGALLKSIIIREENIIIPSGSAMTMWLFYSFSFGYHVDTIYLIKVLVFAFTMGYLAYKARFADISAMLSATLLGVVIITSTNFRWFFILLTFFFLGGVFTRYKYGYKQAKGIAQEKGGIRGYKNVFSNSLAALSLSMAYAIFPSHGQILLTAFLGSVATATGDTLASEIGETYKAEPRMITTFKKVRAGTDGAISSLGECAALFGIFIIAMLAYLFIHHDSSIVIAVIAGGFIGTNMDSIMGATLQQRGYLSNNGVNLLATISGGIISGIVYGLVV